MNTIEGETNIQKEGDIHEDKDTTVLTAETDISVEKIEQATEVLNEENESLIDIDKVKGLIKDEVDLLKFKAYELTKGIKDITLSKAGKIASTTVLGFVLASCASPKVVMAVPQEMTERAEQRQTQTQEAFIPTPTSEATLSPEEIREKRLNEIAEVVKANDYRFTVEELDAYLAKKGRNNSIRSAIDKWKGSSAPFQYYFANDEDIGYLIYPASYVQGSNMTLNDFTQNDIIMMVDERKVGEIVESIYDDLWVWHDGKADIPLEDVQDKRIVVFYMTQEIDKSGELHDLMIPNIGGFFFENVEGKVRHVDYDDAVNGNLTDEEIGLFTDEVLASLKAQEGWIMFTLNEDSDLEDKSFNVKEFNNSIHPATSSDTMAQEIN